MNDEIAFVKLIASRLEAAGVNYMITGSVAMMFYAVPRMTRDIDIVIELSADDAERVADLFLPDCYVDPDTVRREARRRGMFNIIHNTTIVKADFIVRKDARYRREEFARRRRAPIDDCDIWVVAPEDLILSKLVWAKGSSSEMQLRDARQVFDAVGDLDRAYLKQWATELNVTDLLTKVTGNA